MIPTFSGSKLRGVRTGVGMSTTTLAYRLGITEQTVKGYEAGRMVPTVPRLGRLADVLGCTVDDLFDKDAN